MKPKPKSTKKKKRIAPKRKLEMECFSLWAAVDRFERHKQQQVLDFTA